MARIACKNICLHLTVENRVLKYIYDGTETKVTSLILGTSSNTGFRDLIQ
jgi:hypothetical protein